MGEPDDSTERDLVREAASILLHPTKKISVDLLRASGLHRVMLANSYEVLAPEIRDLTGWKPLCDFTYRMTGNVPTEVYKKGERATERWLEKLGESAMREFRAVLLYDGEMLPLPARDYRLYLLRDGRILYYEGGIHASGVVREITCGTALDVLDVLDRRYPQYCYTQREQPFVVMMKAFSRVLGGAIASRRQKLADQEAVQAGIDATIARVTFK